MLFNSFAFIGLLAITFILYYLPLLSRLQVQVLIVSSLVFYAYESPALVLLLLGSAAINIITSYYVVYGRAGRKRTVAVTGIVLNLLLLSFFKYSPLFAHTFFSKTGSVGEFLLHIPLPIGISFFTFEGISLVVDVFKEKYMKGTDFVPPSFQKHARRTLFFISFFPHLVAGPILKAHDFLPQIRDGRKIKDIDWEFCIRKLILGYFLKMVVADNLKDFTFWIAFPYFKAQSTITLLTMLFGYSCQIFADFAGYSLIAIGLAGLFGYRFMDNFNFPYISASFAEFWRRWHISLSSFLKEYLYIPLGGNRKGKFRTYLNLMITMFLGGLWHGAAWSYAVWGSFHGVALAIERFIEDKLKIKTGGFLKALKIWMVFSFVTLAWLLFKLPRFSDVVEYFRAIFQNLYMEDNSQVITYIALYSLPVVIYHVHYLLSQNRLYVKTRPYAYMGYGIMLFMIIVNSGSSGSFIYFQF
jgi:alginate O-acetyltransferase complex protein AlgI